MDWNDLKFFLEVARARSLSAAARGLGVSTSTVSRRIEALEAAWQVQLFRPHRDGYDLTPAGADLLAPAEAAEAQMRQLERAALNRESAPAGPVRIDVPELLGQDVILPNLAGLMQDHPDIVLDIRSSVLPVRLAAQDSDIVLRLVRPERGNYRIRAAGRIRFGIYCAQAYADRCGTPATGAELAAHRVIGWHEDQGFLAMAGWLQDLCPEVCPAVRLGSFTAQLAAVRLGFGLAVLPRFAAVEAGLVPVLTGAPGLTLDLWLLVNEATAATARVRVVQERIDAILKAHAGRLG